MTTLELSFPVQGESLPVDHGYALYAALCRVLPELHEAANRWAVGPIPGQYAGAGTLALPAGRSRLRLRLPQDEIALALPLAGKPLEVGGKRLRLGVPTVRGLVPAPTLVARLVTIKGFTEPAPFLAAVQRKLAERGIDAEAAVPLIEQGARAGQPRRRVLSVRGKRVVGFSLLLTRLSAADSLDVQADPPPAARHSPDASDPTSPPPHPLFSRRKLGCAFFVPVREADA